MYYKDTAIILSRRDFNEDDLLINCYTQKHGKMVLQSKGAKKIKSKLAGHLEPLNLAKINWVTGKGSAKLIGANSIQSFQNIKNNYWKVVYSFYFLEVIDKAIRPRHPDIKIFEFLKTVLDTLANSANLENLEIIKLCFDYKILFLLGYNPAKRKELDKKTGDLISKIINARVDEIIKLHLDKKISAKLIDKAKEYLEEVVEKEINSNKALRASLF